MCTIVIWTILYGEQNSFLDSVSISIHSQALAFQIKLLTKVLRLLFLFKNSAEMLFWLQFYFIFVLVANSLQVLSTELRT